MLYSKMTKLEKEQFNKYPISKELKDSVIQNKCDVYLKTNGYNLYDSVGNIIYQVSMKDNNLALNTKVGLYKTNKGERKIKVIANKYVDFSNANNVLHFLSGLKNSLNDKNTYVINLFNKFSVSGKVDTIISRIKNNMQETVSEFNKILEANNETKQSDLEKAKEYIKLKMKEYNITNVSNDIVELEKDLKNKFLTYEEFKTMFDSEILTKFKASQENLTKCNKLINRIKEENIYRFITENDKTVIYDLLRKVKDNSMDYEQFRVKIEELIRLWQARQLLSKYYKTDNEFPQSIKEIVEDWVNGDLTKEDFVAELVREMQNQRSTESV